uniref:Uncharacterized protein n=1 Tax=Utricularia reniformis TaxID=192314 RepID=A0A1Y0B186_9LAMI|nr:hypothetical protein AEK19_MT0991 [Utricularia reniformis]ART31215.1 hypothetical protein AEK19_MT0991 [Utricularia reniformis]
MFYSIYDTYCLFGGLSSLYITCEYKAEIISRQQVSTSPGCMVLTFERQPLTIH